MLWAAGNVAGPLLGATLVRRFVEPHGSLVHVRGLLGFLALGVLAGPVVGASIGSLGNVVVMDMPAWQVWPKYVVGDALGVLVVAPALLSLGHHYHRRHLAELVSLVVGLAVVPGLVFQNWVAIWDVTLPYLVIPLLMWAALRFGMRGAAWSVLWVAQVANWATATHYGPFSFTGDPTGHAVTALQLFLVIAIVSTLVLASLVHDLSDRDEVGRALWHQAHHDALTGLPNRGLLQLRLTETLAGDRDVDTQVALLMGDIDAFKVINDALGHSAGDEVLVELARRLRSCVRPHDTVARLSGDAFAILAVGIDGPDVDLLGERILRAVADPIELSGGQRITTSISIGVAVAEPDDDSYRLLRDADVALYRAKELGRARVQHFDETLRVAALERLDISQELPAALANHELFCLFQPEVSLGTGTLFGFEALVRWQHPTRGLLPPDRFIPIIEDAGLEPALFAYVLDQALDTQQQWATRLGFRPHISVNLCPRQLQGSQVVQVVASAIARRGLSPGDLWLEVTETAVSHNESSATLMGLHELGVKLAIDDFGTGWSSMARLASFPWDALKIDRSFISALAKNAQAEHLFRATIVMAHALGMQVIAEGVETTDQLELLQALDCDVIQGYLVTRPLDADHAIDHIDATGRWTDPTLHISRQARFAW